MENSGKEQNLEKVENNQNNIPFSNENIMIDTKSYQKEENDNNNAQKIGHFILTPLEAILLNKKMPPGYKLETEEIYLKSLEIPKNLPKRTKKLERYKEIIRQEKDGKNRINEDKRNNINRNNLSNNNNKMKKNTAKENTLNITINNNSESYKINMKCYSGFNKIKSSPNSNFFYVSESSDSPSLSIIEKKIKNFEYKTVNDFCSDLRKLWNYQFKNYAKEPNIYQNICKLSSLSEQICKEITNENIIVKENKNEEISNIKKRTAKFKKDLNDFKVNNQNESHSKNNNKNIDEISLLGQLIRKLDKSQLKGIVPILSDKNNNNLKTFEFDLEKLSPEKYRKLEEYVYSCISKNKNIKSTNINSNNILNKNENKVTKKMSEFDKKNINKSIYNSNSNYHKNFNNKEKITNNETTKKKEEKKTISEHKSFSSDSMSSESSLSN